MRARYFNEPHLTELLRYQYPGQLYQPTIYRF
jgi:hypothetical protein